MVWKNAIELSFLKDKERHCETIDGHKILFIWHDNEVHAIASQCPHFKLPLIKGKITEDNEIICPFHKSVFDLNSGQATCWSPWPPAIGTVLGKISKAKNLKVYPTQINDNQILVAIN
tara:strand:- start:638 stop:991 length:354 start_codon:yes stop_codon:yes gene_type:complete